MTRTRLTFFLFIGLFLSLAAFSLLNQLITDGLLLQLYIGAAIFGIGVISLDFLGILGEHQGDDSADGAFDLDVDGGAEGDFADGFALDVDASGGDLSTDGPGVQIGGSDFDAGDATTGHTLGDGAYTRKNAGHLALQLMAYLRLLVYFAAGFGPTGWVALSTGRGALNSLMWASVAGIISLLLAQAFFRLQQSNTDSTLHVQELLRQQATVTIPLSHREMGKVRVQIGMSVTEQYALASRPDLSFKSGDKVLITRVTDECVYVA
jgi:membrane protein implicated in regulation of membrane protease activity